MKTFIVTLVMSVVGLFGMTLGSLPVFAAGTQLVISDTAMASTCIVVTFTVDVTSTDGSNVIFYIDGTRMQSPTSFTFSTVTTNVPLYISSASPLSKGTHTLTATGATLTGQTTFTCDPTSSGGASPSSSSSGKSVEPPFCKIEDSRLDSSCGGGSSFVTTFAEKRDEGCYISIYSPYGRADGVTVLLLDANAAEIAAAQAQGGNAVIDSADVVNLGTVTIYWLPETGEFQINAGPNEEGKVYVLNFTGCPATNIYTTNSYQESR